MTPPKIAIYNYIRRGFDFQGRSSRSDYWWPRLFMLIISLSLFSLFLSGGGSEWLEAFVELANAGATPEGLAALPDLSRLATFSLTALIVLSLLTLVPDLSLGWRRFHDMGLPGWFHLLFALLGVSFPAVAIGEMIWFAFPGKDGPNRFGSDRTEEPYKVF